MCVCEDSDLPGTQAGCSTGRTLCQSSCCPGYITLMGRSRLPAQAMWCLEKEVDKGWGKLTASIELGASSHTRDHGDTVPSSRTGNNMGLHLGTDFLDVSPQIGEITKTISNLTEMNMFLSRYQYPWGLRMFWKGLQDLSHREITGVNTLLMEF